MKKMFILLVLLTTTIRFVQAKQTTDYTTENDTNFVEHPPRKMEVVTSTIAEDPLYAKQQKPFTPWYIGVSSGLSYGRTTFASFAMDETNPGFNANMLGGYKINKLLSVEVSLDYTHMKLGAYDCCQNLWLGSDGNRYFAPLSGVDSYKYSNLTSTSNLVGLGTHLNIDLLSFWNRYPKWSKWAKWPMWPKWSALVSPAIYGVYSKADVKQSDMNIHTASKLHFGMGIDFGVGRRINSKLNIRLTTGINYLTGAIDGLSREEHKTSYMWNSSLKLTYKL